jgi:TPR repeat protein
MRVLAGLVLAAAAAALPAWAQSPASPQDSGRQFEAGRNAELQQWQWRAQRGVELTPAQKAVDAVQQAIAKRDCPGAVAALNAGLAKSYPEIFTLAGALYEEGVCVRPNWDRAVGLYERAIAAKHPGVTARLAAGYASKAGGKDLAAALWWATRARTPLPAPCAEVAPLAADADKFIAALQAWPAGRFEACAYAAAVMASVQADLEEPDLASGFGMAGTAVLRFTPAEGRIDIQDDAIDAPPAAGVVVAGSAQDSERRAARKAFQAEIRASADRALKRFEKPAAVPADWRVEARHVFAAAR